MTGEHKAEEEELYLPRRKSQLRIEVEKAAESIRDDAWYGVFLLSLDGKEEQRFDSYAQAAQFMASSKGRWYLVARMK
jgi:hypothetical protein